MSSFSMALPVIGWTGRIFVLGNSGLWSFNNEITSKFDKGLQAPPLATSEMEHRIKAFIKAIPPVQAYVKNAEITPNTTKS